MRRRRSGSEAEAGEARASRSEPARSREGQAARCRVAAAGRGAYGLSPAGEAGSASAQERSSRDAWPGEVEVRGGAEARQGSPWRGPGPEGAGEGAEVEASETAEVELT